MLRQRLPVRPVSVGELDDALALCATDRAANVFLAARIIDGAVRQHPGSLLGHYRGGLLAGLAWVAANVVPVGLGEDGAAAIAQRINRLRRGSASIFGASDQVMMLWEHLSPTWGPPRSMRGHQPLMVTRTRPSTLGLARDPRVRPAGLDEVDMVLPAASQMFTEEIGYPPYQGSDRSYRSGVISLIRRGHTFVRVDDGEVVFKADIGSLGLGCAQVQGVWVHPRLRGRGMAVPAMAAVVELILDGPADEVTLYVNDYNAPARAAYVHCGFHEVGSFSTILL
ncbi:MAG: GNAT family N-acetyltransferase [Micrococcales bacterium]|nr:GNAT family N-acetyltransferase [Micrococcales bacterium]